MNPKIDHSDDLYRQYLLEKEMASLLYAANPKERRGLYSKLYERFFRELPESRKIALRADRDQRDFLVDLKLRTLKPLISARHINVLEVGCGTCDFSRVFSSFVESIIAIDATDQLDQNRQLPPNVDLKIMDGPPYLEDGESIDLAFSFHFIEHLHPEDARDHLKEMQRLLKPKGSYFCVTPNLIYGPHDVSQFFGDSVATGLHLKEYGYLTLGKIGIQSGFKSVRAIKRIGSQPSLFNYHLFKEIERILLRMSVSRRKKILDGLTQRNSIPFRPLEQVKLVFTK